MWKKGQKRLITRKEYQRNTTKEEKITSRQKQR